MRAVPPVRGVSFTATYSQRRSTYGRRAVASRGGRAKPLASSQPSRAAGSVAVSRATSKGPSRCRPITPTGAPAPGGGGAPAAPSPATSGQSPSCGQKWWRVRCTGAVTACSSSKSAGSPRRTVARPGTGMIHATRSASRRRSGASRPARAPRPSGPLTPPGRRPPGVRRRAPWRRSRTPTRAPRAGRVGGRAASGRRPEPACVPLAAVIAPSRPAPSVLRTGRPPKPRRRQGFRRYGG